MRLKIVNVNWTAHPLSDTQKLVLQNLGVLYLREFPEREHVDFTHLELEGRLYRKSSGLFVTMAGNFFHAELGEFSGVSWTSDFLLPNGTGLLTADSGMLMGIHTHADGSQSVSFADPAKTHVTPDSFIV